MTTLFKLSPCAMLWSGFGGFLLFAIVFVLSAAHSDKIRERYWKASRAVDQEIIHIQDTFRLVWNGIIAFFTVSWKRPALSFGVVLFLFFSVFFYKAEKVPCGNSQVAIITKPITNKLLSCNCK